MLLWCYSFCRMMQWSTGKHSDSNEKINYLQCLTMPCSDAQGFKAALKATRITGPLSPPARL